MTSSSGRLLMFQIIKVQGDSMSPDYHEGDYVILTTLPFILKGLEIGDAIIFEHKLYGTLIKRIASFDPETGEAYVQGANPESLDSRRLGTIRRERIRGKVIAHFPKN